MSNEELKASVSAIVTSPVFDETGEFPNVIIDADQFYPLMEAFKQRKEFDFDYLFCLTCVDWKDSLMMVYHLHSKLNRHSIVVKGKIANTEQPLIKSVSGLWKTAELLEREVFDLFGVKFEGHPDLRRLFLDESWVGHPLRKNYTDENMIKL